MKKIITVILTAIILFSCVSCFNFKSDYQYSRSFKTQEEFANIMKKDIDRYDENFDFHFYKWGDSRSSMSIIGQSSGTIFNPIITFEGILLRLYTMDEKFGQININCMIMDDEKFLNEFITMQSYWKDVVVDGYTFKCYDKTTGDSFRAHYITENYVVDFCVMGDWDLLIEKGYTSGDFLSSLPIILESKQQLKI